jgi:hypothetical protein
LSPAAPSVEQGPWSRLPAWLRPRAQEPAGGAATGPAGGAAHEPGGEAGGTPAGDRAAGGGRRSRTWLAESAALALVGVFLAVATVNDLARQVSTNHRLIDDLRTWRHYTHHDYHNISIDQLTLGLASKREILCGNTSPGPPGARTQVCLVIYGPVAHRLRTVYGGWYLPAYHQDVRANRYGCFGPASRGRCAR